MTPEQSTICMMADTSSGRDHDLLISDGLLDLSCQAVIGSVWSYAIPSLTHKFPAIDQERQGGLAPSVSTASGTDRS